KVVAAITASSAAVKGQPFSAEAVSESVQTLGDGNRIVQSSTSKIYRNSEGKVRREMSGGKGAAYFNFFGPEISIAEPSGARILLDREGRTAQTLTMVSPEALRVREGQLSEEQRKAVEKLREIRVTVPDDDHTKRAIEETHATTVIAGQAAPLAALSRTPFPAGEGNVMFMRGGPGDSKWDTKTDDLGTQNIEGVMAEGSRRTTTIPAGAIGNERPIEIVYERWYSKELGMVVMSKHSDPRFGEQTYTLKNIIRAEPDPSLFTVPQGFKVIAPQGTYNVRVAKPATPPAAPKSQQ
ncbi:MAG TPA: hypothetical protein VL501_09130, partial [Pyrinomonadaceae bacterium]|nr:hypothetical protein [Pyrinomonadaceae bacterium]